MLRCKHQRPFSVAPAKHRRLRATSLALLLLGMAGAASGALLVTQDAPASVSGTVLDPAGQLVPGAQVALKSDLPGSAPISTATDASGRFLFKDLASGSFTLTVNADGFSPAVVSFVLHEAEQYQASPIALTLASRLTEVRVTVSPHEVAEEQLKQEEKQRLLGVIPNFQVSYAHHAAPLSSGQKFQLAWRTTLDPANFVVTGIIAGVQQANNNFSGYGQGAAGYGKRYGAAYADFITGTFLGTAAFPALFRQDPRYFYKGSGTVRSRVLYAIADSVVCRGDNRHWQFNYSQIAGDVAAGAISESYYPSTHRSVAAFAFENGLIGIGAQAAANLLQEFVFRRLTPVETDSHRVPNGPAH